MISLRAFSIHCHEQSPSDYFPAKTKEPIFFHVGRTLAIEGVDVKKNTI